MSEWVGFSSFFLLIVTKRRIPSVWQGLYLQRPCPLSAFSYFAVFWMFLGLGVNLWTVGVLPPANNSMQGVRVRVYKNIVTRCQIWMLCLQTPTDKSYSFFLNEQSFRKTKLNSGLGDSLEYWKHYISIQAFVSCKAKEYVVLQKQDSCNRRSHV